jgi:MarR family transcriptional regulator, 2-MHQ and catechol-resistance regulon repressor
MVALRDELLPEEVDVLARVTTDHDAAAMLVVQNVFRASAGLRTTLERDVLAPRDLSFGAFTMLFCLWVWGPLEVREAAERMAVSRPTVSGIADTLERRALLERREHESDARRRSLALTAAGEQAFAQLFPLVNRHEGAACGVLEPEESAELARLLRKLVHGTRGER